MQVYRVFAEHFDYDPLELWVAERDAYVLYGRIAFRPDSGEQLRNCLYLNREWVVEGRVERYVGPVATIINGADAEGGITRAELARGHFWLLFDSETAVKLNAEKILVGFDLDDAEYATLQQQVTEIFDGLGVLRILNGSFQEPSAQSED